MVDRLIKIIAGVAVLGALALAWASTSKTWPTMEEPDPQVSGPAPPELSFDGHEIAVLDEALKRKPDHAPILLRLAKLKADAGKHDAAAGHLQEILLMEPENLDARLELGRIRFEQGNIQAAIRQHEVILELDPGHPDALYNMGAIYGNLGQRELALQYWERLRAAHPDSASGTRAQMSIRKLIKDPQ